MNDKNPALGLWKWGVLGGILLLLIGFEVGSEGMRARMHSEAGSVAKAQEDIATAMKTVEEAKAQNIDAMQKLNDASVQVERFKAAYANAMALVAALQQQLRERVAMPQVATSSVFTVLYESGRSSVNVSLLPLPGAPRIALNPGSQLAPRWIVPGQIQPKMVGETRQALYFYYDTAANAWSGPYSPLRVTPGATVTQ